MWNPRVLAIPAALLMLCGVWTVPNAARAQSRLFVATNGNDAWSGTRPAPNRRKTDGPFATLERARDEIRKLKQADKVPASGVAVELRGGTYFLTQTFVLEKQDSGTERGPIVYRRYRTETVRLVGGKRLSGFGPVTDPAVLARLAPEAEGHVLQLDLRAEGITDYGPVKGTNTPNTGWPGNGLAPVELFFDTKPMTLARWPNDEFAIIGEVPDPKKARTTFRYDGNRPERWVNEEDVWLQGYWGCDWENSRQTLNRIDLENRTLTIGGSPRCRKGKRYFALNLLPELDAPGEYYIDRPHGILYFWPPAPLERGESLVSTLPDLVQMKGTRYVVLDHLTLEVTRGLAVLMRGGAHNLVVGCTIRNTGDSGIRVSWGKEHGVVGCDVYETGKMGIRLEGGNRKKLEPAGHYAENNNLYRYARRRRCQPAIFLMGVGSRARHNLIHDAPHQAIYVHDGNEHLIEFNEIHNVAEQTGDVGAYYTYCNWTTRGNVIRYNFFHHIRAPGECGSRVIYLDFGPSGTTIYGNVFYKVGECAIWIGGGRDNTIKNNVFVDCKRGVQVLAQVAEKKYVYHTAPDGTMMRNLKQVPYTEPPWSTRYPHLANILEDEFKLPKYNLVAHNISVGGKWTQIDKKAAPHVEVRDNLVGEDPLFVDAANMNFQLRNDSPAFRRIGFKRIPFEKIGLYKSTNRASWPVEHPILELPVPLHKRARNKPRPVFKVARLQSTPRIDGRLQPSEWAGRDPAKAMVLERLPGGKKAAPRSLAWLAYDENALYLAVDNEVSTKAPLRIASSWGGNDAVELAIQNAAAGDEAPILILRGYPSGQFESADDAGIPRGLVERVRNGVQYAAQIPDPARWSAEWRIPWDSLGVDPGRHRKFAFNLTARKTATDQFMMWCGVGPSWHADRAGTLVLDGTSSASLNLDPNAPDVFFNMDLSKYRDGTVWTEKISKEVFGAGAAVNKFLQNGQVKIVNDPYGSGKKVLRLELRPEDFGNVITPHVNIYKYGAPANMREGTSILEVALSDTWGHGPTGIHMPFWRSKRFRAQRVPILPDVYAFFHQYCGNNSSIDARWRDAGYGGGPFRKSTIDHISCFYTYDQGRFQRVAFGNLDDPRQTRLPVARPAQWKTGGYVTQQAHIKLSTPGVNNGFYKGYHDGQLVFDKSNIMTLAAGQNEDLELFAFVFYVNGGDGTKGNPVQWNVPDDGVGPKYMYIRTFMLKAGGPVRI